MDVRDHEEVDVLQRDHGSGYVNIVNISLSENHFQCGTDSFVTNFFKKLLLCSKLLKQFKKLTILFFTLFLQFKIADNHVFQNFVRSRGSRRSFSRFWIFKVVPQSWLVIGVLIGF